MRWSAFALVLGSTPALAHHEVIVATSMVPTMLGLAMIASVALGALWRKWRRKLFAVPDDKLSEGNRRAINPR